MEVKWYLIVCVCVCVCVCVFNLAEPGLSCGMQHEGFNLGLQHMVGVKGLNHWTTREVPQCVFDLHFSDD